MKQTNIVSNGPAQRRDKGKEKEYEKKSISGLFVLDGKKGAAPTSFHVSRTANHNFRIMLDPPEIPLPESTTTLAQRGNLGTFVLKGREVNVTPTDFYRFVFAASQMLHTTNYLNGDPSLKGKTKKGQTKEEPEKDEIIREERRTQEAEGKAENANKTIVFRLDDCAKLMYGTEKPSSEQRKRIQTLIDFLHNCPVIIKDPRGKIRHAYLCTKQTVEVEYENGNNSAKPIMYALNLNPIFVYEWATNFCELPRDIMARISKATRKTTEAHLAMLSLLSRQNRKAPLHRTMRQLTKDLGMTDEYANDKSRAEKKILEICEAFKEIRMLSGYHVTKGGKWIESISFFFSDKFIDRAPKNPEEGNEQDKNNVKEG